jgi:hypothetical protein
MILLLIIFSASLVLSILYGEIWQIRFSTQDAPVETLNRERITIAFISSSICVASGFSMIYLSNKIEQTKENNEYDYPN